MCSWPTPSNEARASLWVPEQGGDVTPTEIVCLPQIHTPNQRLYSGWVHFSFADSLCTMQQSPHQANSAAGRLLLLLALLAASRAQGSTQCPPPGFDSVSSDTFSLADYAAAPWCVLAQVVSWMLLCRAAFRTPIKYPCIGAALHCLIKILYAVHCDVHAVWGR